MVSPAAICCRQGHGMVIHASCHTCIPHHTCIHIYHAYHTVRACKQLIHTYHTVNVVRIPYRTYMHTNHAYHAKQVNMTCIPKQACEHSFHTKHAHGAGCFSLFYLNAYIDFTLGIAVFGKKSASVFYSVSTSVVAVF